MASQKTGHERFTAGAKPGESVLSVILATHYYVSVDVFRRVHCACTPSVVDPEAKRRKRSTANHFSRVKTQLVA
jgi:hypothetical protein